MAVNVVYVLEKMGYANGIDFEHRSKEGLIWLSHLPQPTEEELEILWEQYTAEDEPRLVEEDREMTLKRIDSYAGNKRSKYISAGTGQELVYEEKANQAQAFKDGGYVNPENYPFINQEAVIKGITPQEVADTVLVKKQEWIAVGVAIETLRLTAKELVRNATTRQEILDIVNQYIDDITNL